jgi:hypothetical protein
MSLDIAPMGMAYLLIIETVDPESRSTRKSLKLLTVPIVLAVQMVIGDSCVVSQPLVHDSHNEVHRTLC